MVEVSAVDSSKQQKKKQKSDGRECMAMQS